MTTKNEFSVAKVAAELGLSKKTVYRAIHRSGMVKSSTQEYILDYINTHYPDMTPAQTATQTKIITVVIPRKPNYFWQPIINEMQEALSAYPQDAIRLRTICFSGVRNDTELLTILSQITPENTDALIVVPVNSENCLPPLREMSKHFPVVIFDDYFDCDSETGEDDFYYVHGNGRLEGEEMANLVAMSSLKEKNILILLLPFFSCHTKERIKGFCARIAQHDSCRVVKTLDLSHLLQEFYNSHTTLPAQLSRELAKYFASHPEDNVNCLYVPDGMLSQVCSAHIKLRLGEIQCFGHEINETAQRFFDGGIRGGYVTKDIHFQSQTAIQLVAEKLLYNRAPAKRKYITPFTSALIND